MKIPIAIVTCLAFAMLAAEPARAGMKDSPNFGYDEQGKPHRDLMEFRRKRGHGGGQSQKKHPAKACKGARNSTALCVQNLFRPGI
jgi:hypothetical protein